MTSGHGRISVRLCNIKVAFKNVLSGHSFKFCYTDAISFLLQQTCNENVQVALL